MTGELTRGTVGWVDFSPTQGREQHGNRPALVVSSQAYLASIPDLVIVVPVTSVDRGWPHHVPIQGSSRTLPEASFAMTEQPRVIARGRLSRLAGRADAATMAKVDQWLRDFIGL